MQKNALAFEQPDKSCRGPRYGKSRFLTLTTALFITGLALAGCNSVDRTTTGSVAKSSGTKAERSIEQMNAQQLAQAAQTYGAHYQKNPTSKVAALNYATVLSMAGRSDQSLAVMRAIAIQLPKDKQVLAAYGKALAGAGELDAALDAVRRAQTPDYPDWRLLSAEGAILDQQGNSADARVIYQKALQIKPGEASVLSNLAMSYVLSGDLPTAEKYLRQAATANGSDSRVRQNLALVVGLQGRFQEAETIASRELSPEQAKANTDYLRSMLARQGVKKQA
ncbi:tetratricopeptide repeat protein [Ochrobactrum sp. SFR4]|uniref:tetratricopeptide repeat protein n=1 Tax=Ochrobactrum sp. SFR4 TaxID=2717368 RepID=UPI000EFC0E83|nr:tetratricopeptide repeat protein [Ochrobactrum sp. SFR4]